MHWTVVALCHSLVHYVEWHDHCAISQFAQRIREVVKSRFVGSQTRTDFRCHGNCCCVPVSRCAHLSLRTLTLHRLASANCHVEEANRKKSDGKTRILSGYMMAKADLCLVCARSERCVLYASPLTTHAHERKRRVLTLRPISIESEKWQQQQPDGRSNMLIERRKLNRLAKKPAMRRRVLSAALLKMLWPANHPNCGLMLLYDVIRWWTLWVVQRQRHLNVEQRLLVFFWLVFFSVAVSRSSEEIGVFWFIVEFHWNHAHGRIRSGSHTAFILNRI